MNLNIIIRDNSLVKQQPSLLCLQDDLFSFSEAILFRLRRSNLKPDKERHLI